MPKGGHHFVFVFLVAFRATSVNICKSGDAGKIYSPPRVRNMQMDKGVLSQWQRGEGERQEGASERGRERVEVGASLSFAGDEGFYGGGGTQARASLFLSLSLSLSRCIRSPCWSSLETQLRTGRGRRSVLQPHSPVLMREEE